MLCKLSLRSHSEVREWRRVHLTSTVIRLHSYATGVVRRTERPIDFQVSQYIACGHIKTAANRCRQYHLLADNSAAAVYQSTSSAAMTADVGRLNRTTVAFGDRYHAVPSYTTNTTPFNPFMSTVVVALQL